MNSRVWAATSAAIIALGAGTYVVAQTTEPSSPLPAFGKDLCGSYVEKTAAQVRRAVRSELEPLNLRGAYRECVVRAVAFLREGVYRQCLDGEFDDSSQTQWDEATSRAFVLCAPGPVEPPAPEPEPPVVPVPPAG